MSITTANLNVLIVPKKKRTHVGAVQLVFDTVPDCEGAGQLPTFNQFRKIRVPSHNAPTKSDKVPVKFEQEGSDYSKVYSEEFQGEKLPAKAHKVSEYSFVELLLEMNQPDSKLAEYDYSKGIRPGKRMMIDTAPTANLFR